jgi:hypothetical protein
MIKIDFSTYLNGIGNDLKISIDDVIAVINGLNEDVEKLKTKTSKPDKDTAQALLEYLAMDEGKSKQNIEVLCGSEIQQYFKWIEDYCSEHNCTQEEILNAIIEDEIKI